MTDSQRFAEATGDIQCPVCGYYCLGKGGFGCIDKPKLVELEDKRNDELELLCESR